LKDIWPEIALKSLLKNHSRESHRPAIIAEEPVLTLLLVIRLKDTYREIAKKSLLRNHSRESHRPAIIAAGLVLILL